jgi:hypothetical protein
MRLVNLTPHEWSKSNKQQRHQRERDRNKGYYCAVATLLRMEGCVGTQIKALFRAGGDLDGIDEDDLQLFTENGLTKP